MFPKRLRYPIPDRVLARAVSQPGQYVSKHMLVCVVYYSVFL